MSDMRQIPFEVDPADGFEYQDDVVIFGIIVTVNAELVIAAGLQTENGIVVNETAQTSDENIDATGDCSFHFNPLYNRFIRLESVQRQ